MAHDGEAYQELVEDLDAVKSSSRKLSDSARGTSSLVSSVINLFKSIVGAGVLSLPAGVAAFSDDDFAFIPSLGVAAVLGCISAYSFWVIGRLSLEREALTYSGLMLEVFGTAQQKVVEVIVVAKVGSASLMYEIIIGDLATDLAKLTGCEHVIGRTGLLIIIAIVLLVPLGLMKSFAALAPFAAVGTMGVLYTASFMGYRLVERQYSVGGIFYGHLGEKPEFSLKGTSYGRIFVLISMLATAYIAHFNAPKFAQQLHNPTQARFGLLCALAYFFAFSVMAFVMSVGFLTFGGTSDGLILDNYSVDDDLAAIGRIATLVSVIAGFPFLLAAFCDGLLLLVLKPKEAGGGWGPSPRTRKAATVTLVALLTSMAILLDDLGFVVALMGALFATALIYILPALALIKTMQPRVRDGRAGLAERLEYMAGYAMFVLGCLLAVIGAGVVIYGHFAVGKPHEA